MNRKQKQKTEMRNSLRCAVGHLVVPAAVAVAVAVTLGELIDFKNVAVAVSNCVWRWAVGGMH